MPVIYVGRTKPQGKGRGRRKNLWRIAVGVVGLCVAADLLLCLVFSGRTYPRTSVADRPIGSVSLDKLPDKISQVAKLPDTIIFTSGQDKVLLPISEVGASLDIDRSVASAHGTHNWLALIDVFLQHELDAPFKIDDSILKAKAAPRLVEHFQQRPVDARLELSGTEFKIIDDRPGATVNKSALEGAILEALRKGSSVVVTPTVRLTAQTTAKKLQQVRDDLRQQLQTEIRYTYKARSVAASPQDIASWFVASGNSLVISDQRLRQFIADKGYGMDVRARNLTDAVAATKNALASHQPLSFALAPYEVTKTINYCVAGKDIDNSLLADFRSGVRDVYDDLRGWSLDGQVIFKEVASGCDFTIWLSAPKSMPSFGAICDEYWNCRPFGTNNIIMNLDRWQQATPAWKAAGGNLADYRALMIDHETGHWLGFDDATCPGAGQPAPAMMQQSINLGGCTFNPWPTPNEITTVHRYLGL